MIEIKAPEELIPMGMLAKLDRSHLSKLAHSLANAARYKWIQLAQVDNQYGKHMRFDYIRGIQKPIVSEGTAVISLVGVVPNILEHGDDGQDMRETHLGENVSVAPRGQRGKHEDKQGGYYRYIPFRHTSPGASRGAVGQEMGTPYTGHQSVSDAKKLGREVYAHARSLEATRSQPGMGVRYGGRLSAGLAPKLRDHHKTDIYAGMIHEIKTYEKATQGQYVTFRTISTHTVDEKGRRVDATVGWKRKPIPARNYAEQVSAFVEKIAANAAKIILEG